MRTRYLTFESMLIRKPIIFIFLWHLCSPAFCQDTPTDLLRKTIIEVRDEEGSPSDTIARFRSNLAYSVQPNTWNIRIPANPLDLNYGGYTVHINQRLNSYTGTQSDPPFNVKTTFQSVGASTNYTLAPINPGYVNDTFRGAPAYRIDSKFLIAACEFNFLSRANCYPLVRVKNLSTSAPRVTFTIFQSTFEPRVIEPMQEVLLDRSDGEIVISLADLISEHVPPDIQLQIALHEGEAVSITPGLSLEARLSTYRRLLELRRTLAEVAQDTGDPSTRAKVKSLTTSIRVISAMAVEEKYPEIILELLKSKAKDIVEINDQVVALRNLVLANGIASMHDINVSISKIDLLLADPNMGQKDTLRVIRDELSRALADSADQDGAIAIIRDRIISSVDRLFDEYQLLVLEYSQFIPNDRLAIALAPTLRTTILSKVTKGDVIIQDETQGGRGVAMRSAFGLPNPR